MIIVGLERPHSLVLVIGVLVRVGFTALTRPTIVYIRGARVTAISRQRAQRQPLLLTSTMRHAWLPAFGRAAATIEETTNSAPLRLAGLVH